MMTRFKGTLALIAACLIAGAVTGPSQAAIEMNAEEFVQANGADIVVPGYSVPSFIDWDEDGLPDLIVGEGSGVEVARVRVFLNIGIAGAPAFGDHFFAQTAAGELSHDGSGCLGICPGVVQWDADGKKDLLIGMSTGGLILHLNVGTNTDPLFDAGTALQVGAPGEKVDISVGYRATPTLIDWDSDGKRDLAVGAYDGRIHLFINSGSDTAPDFLVETFAIEDGDRLAVPSSRSAPMVGDFDLDGRKDLISGNTDGELWFYCNVGTDTAPLFSGCETVYGNGEPIDLPGTPRSRPSLCEWTGDGHFDILVGSGDGLVRLYRGREDTGLPSEAPQRIALHAPWPNPCNPRVSIPFELEADTGLKLSIHDASGRRVATLTDRTWLAGQHMLSWNGRTDGGEALPSGLYLVRLASNDNVRMRKLVLLQ